MSTRHDRTTDDDNGSGSRQPKVWPYVTLLTLLTLALVAYWAYQALQPFTLLPDL